MHLDYLDRRIFCILPYNQHMVCLDPEFTYLRECFARIIHYLDMVGHFKKLNLVACQKYFTTRTVQISLFQSYYNHDELINPTGKRIRKFWISKLRHRAPSTLSIRYTMNNADNQVTHSHSLKLLSWIFCTRYIIPRVYPPSIPYLPQNI